MRCCFGAVMMASVLAAAAPAAAPPKLPPGALTQPEQAWLSRRGAAIRESACAGRFGEASERLLVVAAFRERVQGRDYWETIDARLQVERWKRLVKLPAKAQAEAGRALDLTLLAVEA